NPAISITGYYTVEQYDTEQSNRSWRGNSPPTAFDPANNWFADVDDDVDTWNIGLAFPGLGEHLGLRPGALELGLDYTQSDVESNIAVTGAENISTAPLPELRSDMTSFSAYARFYVNDQAAVRLSVEWAELDTEDFGLDGVGPDTLSNVLLLGESAANYDVTLVSLSYLYRW
ncbi:MAG: MtrB/PioB family outer membrane beta-barrel protein, partial [Xanthomonadales bacterium]|nr:MtrB/PioB family outer membrane beta-barrel protein [Xanthomonadales bacterium]